jgi:hypothetical protein
MAMKLKSFSFVKSLTNLCFLGSINPLLFQKTPFILNWIFLFACSLGTGG